MSDTGLKLNFDILLMLMDYIDRKDVLSLMQTCHFMYIEGIPTLLRYPVVLSYERDFDSFCEFMLASPFIRPRYLRELIMGSTARFPKELVNRLVLVLTRAEGLEKFTIACENDPSEAAVMAALAATTSITHLSIESPNATVAQVLQEWKSAVTKVAVSFDERRLIGQSDDFRMRNLDPTWIFAPLAHSVREMQAIWPRYFSANIVFPAVDTLQVHAYRPAALSATMRTFPHLRRLVVSFEMGFDPDKLLRERHENEVGEQSEHWRRLEYVQGDVGSVYVCSLPCTVEHLDLTVPHRCRNADVLIPAVAGAARPTRLDLHFIENCVHLEPLEAALRAASSFVTHLDITYRVPCDDVKIRYIIDDILAAFPLLTALKEVTLTMNWYRADRVAPRFNGRAAEPDMIEKTLKSYDCEALALRMSSLIPSEHLEKIRLNFAYNGDHEWQVASGKQERSLTLAAVPRS